MAMIDTTAGPVYDESPPHSMGVHDHQVTHNTSDCCHSHSLTPWNDTGTGNHSGLVSSPSKLYINGVEIPGASARRDWCMVTTTSCPEAFDHVAAVARGAVVSAGPRHACAFCGVNALESEYVKGKCPNCGAPMEKPTLKWQPGPFDVYNMRLGEWMHPAEMTNDEIATLWGKHYEVADPWRAPRVPSLWDKLKGLFRR